MPIRLQEIHPALVHFPIALLPTAVVADALGRATGNEALLGTGRTAIAVAAVSGLVAGAFGFVAQQAVNLNDHTEDLLVTHRNGNLLVMALTTLMAVDRVGRRGPTVGYLAVGALATAVSGYTAYLGGRMVYEHGLGVKPADGVRAEDAPQVMVNNLAHPARTAAGHLRDAVRPTVEHLRDGDLAPAVGGSLRRDYGDAPDYGDSRGYGGSGGYDDSGYGHDDGAHGDWRPDPRAYRPRRGGYSDR